MSNNRFDKRRHRRPSQLTSYQRRVRRDLKAYREIVAQRKAYRNRWRHVCALELRNYSYIECLVIASSLSKDYAEGVGPLANLLYCRCNRGRYSLYDIK